jgi:hypothetical protein
MVEADEWMSLGKSERMKAKGSNNCVEGREAGPEMTMDYG